MSDTGAPSLHSLTSLAGLNHTTIQTLLADAARIRDSLGNQTTASAGLDDILAGRWVVNMFFEPSTRTRLSFTIAARNLGGAVLDLDAESSSLSKGESLEDTAATAAALGADLLIVRHSNIGAPQAVADHTSLPVISAGDGTGEHPTQALGDAVTLQQQFGDLEGLTMAVVGDVARSRVANSLRHLLPALGVDLRLVGPPGWVPEDTGLPYTHSLDEVVADTDVLYMLRAQQERGTNIGPDYAEDYQLTPDRARRMRPGAVLMHPGPVNRDVELAAELVDAPNSLIAAQVANSVPTRMAVLAAAVEDGF